MNPPPNRPDSSVQLTAHVSCSFGQLCGCMSQLSRQLSVNARRMIRQRLIKRALGAIKELGQHPLHPRRSSDLPLA